MEITIHARDWAIAGMALVGVVLTALAALAVLQRVLGRHLVEVEEQAAAWLLRDAAGWRARAARKAQLSAHRPVLLAAEVEVE